VAYSLWQGVRLKKLRGLWKLVILGDSMIVIWNLINHNDNGTKAILGAISWALSLIKEFRDYNFFHIKCELNNQVDH